MVSHSALSLSLPILFPCNELSPPACLPRVGRRPRVPSRSPPLSPCLAPALLLLGSTRIPLHRASPAPAAAGSSPIPSSRRLGRQIHASPPGQTSTIAAPLLPPRRLHPTLPPSIGRPLHHVGLGPPQPLLLRPTPRAAPASSAPRVRRRRGSHASGRVPRFSRSNWSRQTLASLRLWLPLLLRLLWASPPSRAALSPELASSRPQAPRPLDLLLRPSSGMTPGGHHRPLSSRRCRHPLGLPLPLPRALGVASLSSCRHPCS